MSEERFITVEPGDDGQRLDRWLKKHMPFGLIQKLIRKGAVRVDGKKVKQDERLVAGQQVRIPPIEKQSTVSKPAPRVSKEDADYIRSLVIFDDGDLVAINKPHGLASQGGTGQTKHVDGLLPALKSKDGLVPRLVHRLDKDTSGVLLLARKPDTIRALGKSFKHREVRKVYLALTVGVPDDHEGAIRAPLLKTASGSQKEKMHIDDEEGKNAITEFAVIEHAAKKAAFMAFWPRTGRTHQIRIHAAEVLGCPVLGDGKYGGPEARLEGLDLPRRLHLHAWKLILPHPVKKGMLELSAPLPPDLVKSWKALGFNPRIKNDPFADIAS